MESEEAVDKLKEWALFWDLDTERELYKVVVDELRYQVKRERLTFDIENEGFKYQLKKPVKGVDGEIGIVEIRETTMEDKKILQKYGDDETIQAATAMMAKYTGLKISEVGQLYDRDTSNINAVISGFITQILPQKKS